MRTPRIFILAVVSFASLFFFCRALLSVGQERTTTSFPPPSSQKPTLRSFFSFTTPFTLFPPNAIITIVDDNSTSFAARPAAFGPPLPVIGLNGQLWVGSGFSEETIVDGEGEGELGCSDVPGWNDGSSISALKHSLKEVQASSKSTTGSPQQEGRNRDTPKIPLVGRSDVYASDSKTRQKPAGDGTDDYLHQHLARTQRLASEASAASSSGHADIQSIQEGAEIEGKIVLLSRGGCGFLEKVKWAQRRGAIGLIVGDNQRGGPLIQMYAHGDTTNVSIPSIFTSRTTAYLLSLMMQPGSFLEDTIDDNGKPTQKVQQYDRSKKNKIASSPSSAVHTVRQPLASRSDGQAQLKESRSLGSEPPARSGWFSRLFGSSSQSKPSADSRYSRNSQMDWNSIEDISDKKKKGTKNKGSSKSNTRQPLKDGFRIGVEDWRDPDLVGEDKSESATHGNSKASKGHTRPGQTHYVDKPSSQGPGRVGSAPSSQDYATSHMPVKGKDAIGLAKDKSATPANPGLISKLFGDGSEVEMEGDEDQFSSNEPPLKGKPGGVGTSSPPPEREGLWVVITPTSGASPFFDTLLVLVVSPLITLTVVYALLILRARIRRRRWRAPKSVVDRLPVRTYHTVASSPTHSPRLPSPTSSSPTMPLLQGQHGPSRSRPRSRTTTGVPSADDLLDINASQSVPGTARAEEKRSNPSQWRKYMGRQVECVVCLEEYVDGVSQVMSLPCGHEFHVDCITPWLTTRRRTCPICKGDVVRSLARGSPSSPRYEPYRDESEDDDILASSSGPSTSPSRSDDDSPDLEQGLLTRPHGSRQPGWLNRLSSNIPDQLFAFSWRRPNDSENRDR